MATIRWWALVHGNSFRCAVLRLLLLNIYPLKLLLYWSLAISFFQLNQHLFTCNSFNHLFPPHFHFLQHLTINWAQVIKTVVTLILSPRRHTVSDLGSSHPRIPEHSSTKEKPLDIPIMCTCMYLVLCYISNIHYL